MHWPGIAKLSECDQNLGHTRIHHALIVQHAGSWPEGENQLNLTEVDNTLFSRVVLLFIPSHKTSAPLQNQEVMSKGP